MLKMLLEGEEFQLTKDELKLSNCCRFCGFGAKKEAAEGDDFTRMYEKLVLEDDYVNCVTLDVLINKYLPISVSSHELYYPQVICSPCTFSLTLTVDFFQKIAKGQKILAKIINQNNNNDFSSRPDGIPVPVDAYVTESPPFVFSDRNPILQAPKRRGRPRRDPNKPKVLKVDPPLVSEYLESKPKRRSRRPVRYEESVDSPLIKTETDDLATETEGNLPALVTEDFENAVGPENHTTDDVSDLKNDIALIVPSEFTSLTRTDNIMDLSKLNVILDGDEECDLPSSLDPPPPVTLYRSCSSESTVTASAEGSSSTHRDKTLAEIHTSSGAVSVTSPRDAAHCLTTTNLNNINDMCDSDTSVRTMDFVINRPKKKRGRKKGSNTKVRKKHKNNTGTKKTYECGICPRQFSHPSSLTYHRNSVHVDAKKFVCEICNKAFSHRQLLLNHSYVHSDEKFFKCQLCPAKFKSKSSLYTHNKSIHTPNSSFTCDYCESHFNLKSTLKAHLRLHTGERPYSCDFCSKRFSQKSNYTEHRRIHTGEKPYRCDYESCDKAFTTASQLRCHKNTHSGCKQFLCSVCGRGFTNAENFKYHMRRHNGEKPLECSICLKQFTEPWSFKKHCRLHSGEKPYTCTLCNKLFSDPSNFAKHKRVHGLDGDIDAFISEALIQESPPPLSEDDPEHLVDTHSDHQSEGLGMPDHNEGMHLDTLSATHDDAHNVHEDVPRLMDVTDHSVEGVPNFGTDGGGYIHILNSENLNTLEDGGGQDGQVIYLYPEDMSYYTITISENDEVPEGAQPAEEALQAALGGGVAYAAVDADLAAQYFNFSDANSSSLAVPALSSEDSVSVPSPDPIVTSPTLTDAPHHVSADVEDADAAVIVAATHAKDYLDGKIG